VHTPPAEPHPDLPQDLLIDRARHALPSLSALYRLRAPAPRAITLGVLYDGPRLTPIERWQVISHLTAGITPAPELDLVDLCTLEPIRQLHLLETGARLWARDITVDLYEANIRSQKGAAQAHRLQFLADLRALQRTPPEGADAAR
jgi:hypothetical protein